ncbi:TetR/AcrR family transcriptional regulator [Anoxybacillus sp. J5B_2022]|uniref:TetR/AcrR family transcriptional regulator n=1 Tax=Anoxybacillus sp. J5B_2022 TaxID=3003246 RepID=UPI0022867718|nr:TetR/AcrR family transcriptional regulator [Anoxybacillus sp. J5B_2022]MCZ0753972.1 helix-turn-helix domain containing protein [Anoxybacillus sp. J5B_2022]
MAKQRKVKFLEKAMKLFAEKGYHATSIQDIVEAWGISKGAFYHHFSSKEELMFEIVKYHLEKLLTPFMDAKPEGWSDKEWLTQQLTMQLEGIVSQKDFFQMMMAEQLPKINADIQRYLFAQRARVFNWYCQRLMDIYGEKVEKYVLDVAAMLNGILREYIFYMMFDPSMFRAEAIARFIVRRMDAIVAHFDADEEPVLKEEAIRCFTEIAEQEQHERKAQIIAGIGRLKEQVSALAVDKKTHHQLHAALDTLEAEFANEQATPREYVVKGILLYIESQRIQPLSEAVASLTELVHEYMTHHHR